MEPHLNCRATVGLGITLNGYVQFKEEVEESECPMMLATRNLSRDFVGLGITLYGCAQYMDEVEECGGVLCLQLAISPMSRA